MVRRRILYLICLIGCIGFFIGYRAWLSWLLLVAIALLPWLSLLLSLPAMLLAKAEFRFPKSVVVGEKLPLKARVRSWLPIPPVHWKYHVTELYTGNIRKYKEDSEIIAKHCGSLQIKVKKAWKYDYLGLFRLPITWRKTQTVLVLPKPIPVKNLPGLKRYIAGRWMPKPGDGFAENYDLRLYRPGDDLRLVHWKLSAKTGKTVIREPIIPVRGKLILTMLLRGNAEVLDAKLGKLCYLSDMLLKKELPHELHCLTADGVCVYKLTNQEELQTAMHALLCARLTQEKEMPCVKASWQYRIGGELDEV